MGGKKDTAMAIDPTCFFEYREKTMKYYSGCKVEFKNLIWIPVTCP